jgi:hypothetical protein
MLSMSYSLTHDDLVEKLRQQVGFLERSARLFDEGNEDEAIRLAQIIRVLLHDTSGSHSLLGQLGVKETINYLDTSEPIDPANVLSTAGLAEIKVESGPAETIGSYVAPLGGHDTETGSQRAQSVSRRKQSRRKRRGPTRQREKPEQGVFFMRGAALVPGAQPSPVGPPPYSRQKPFAEWWNDPVTKDSTGAIFARSNYVLACAHKEGGAHVDPALDAEWAGLTRNNTLNWHTHYQGIGVAIGPTAASGGIEVPLGNPALATVRQIAYEIDQTLRTQLSHLL